MKKMSRGFLPAVISCFLTSAVYSNTQPSCHLITDLVAKETAHIVTMTITSDWISTDLCVCYLSTSYDSTYLTFDLVAPSDSDAICGPYLTVEPISGSSFYNVCPRSGSSPHGATISNQSSITVALWSKDPNKSLLGANITFHSYIPMKLTCRQVNNSSLNLDCPCWKAQDFSSPRSIRQSDIDYSTRLMRGLVVSFSFLFVCGLLALFFTLNKRFHITERLKQKLSHFGSAAAQSVTHCGSRKSAFEASNSYDELATVIAQPIEDLTNEKIDQLTNTSETCNKASEKAISKSLHGYTNSGIYEEIPFEKLRDVGIAALGDTNSLCPYATSSEVRDLELRANLVGRGALSAGDICRWNYTSSTADHVLKPSVRMSVERPGKEPETEVIYGTVKKLKRTSGNGIHTESSTSDQDGVSSMLGQQVNDTIV